MKSSHSDQDRGHKDAGSALMKAWQIDAQGHEFGDDVTNLILAERAVPLEVSMDRSLRAKVIDACGMTCTFCHNEGTPVASDVRRAESSSRPSGGSGRVSVFSDTNGVNFIPSTMEGDASFRLALDSLRDDLGLDELHLTGGEPTLNRHLPGIVSTAVEAGYNVKMTSNGENGARIMGKLASAGLSKVNFSIFGTTPEELASVQHAKYADRERAARKIVALHRSIDAAVNNGVGVAANVVVSDVSHHPRIYRILEDFAPQIELRILPDLDRGAESYYAIYKLLSDIGSRAVSAQIEAGSSNARVFYRLPDEREIGFKQIRPTKIEACSDCRYNNDEDCKEGYYGVRLYRDETGKYLVGVCIQRMDMTLPIDEFRSGPLIQQIAELRDREYVDLSSQYPAA